MQSLHTIPVWPTGKEKFGQLLLLQLGQLLGFYGGGDYHHPLPRPPPRPVWTAVYLQFTAWPAVSNNSSQPGQLFAVTAWPAVLQQSRPLHE